MSTHKDFTEQVVIQRKLIKTAEPTSLDQEVPVHILPEDKVARFLSMAGENASAARHHKVQGKVCPKHPELMGIRYKTSRSCLGCREDARLKKIADLKRLPLLEQRIKDLQDQLLEMHEAAKQVLDARTDDDAPHGHPNHCHNRPGHWDKDGSVCEHCAAYSRLESLIPAGNRGVQPVVNPKLTDWLIRSVVDDNLLLAADLFFEPGLVNVVNGVQYIKYGLGIIPWEPLTNMEHSMHLASKIHAEVYYDKGIQVKYTVLGETGEETRVERVVEMWHGEGIDKAQMRKVAQVAVYLAKCQRANA